MGMVVAFASGSAGAARTQDNAPTTDSAPGRNHHRPFVGADRAAFEDRDLEVGEEHVRFGGRAQTRPGPCQMGAAASERIICLVGPSSGRGSC